MESPPTTSGDAPKVFPRLTSFRTADHPGTLGQIGPEARHFVVEEIPAYSPVGQGEHLYLWIEKVGLNTPDVERRIARALGINPRDVGYAGLKDRNAITRQWFSALSKHTGEGLELGEGVLILECARHENKLRTGHLRGNRFIITLVDVPHPERAEGIAQRLIERRLGNFFGAQRFGRGGQNLSQSLGTLRAGPRARGRRSHFDAKLGASVIQAELFNRYALLRLARPEPLFEGEVVRLEGSAKCFIVEDVAQELPRLERGDIHLTGPMVGPKMVAARGVPFELEQEVLRELELGVGELTTLAEDAPGTRRDLLVAPEGLRIESSGPDSLRLEFALPAGSYATELIREFTRSPTGDRPISAGTTPRSPSLPDV